VAKDYTYDKYSNIVNIKDKKNRMEVELDMEDEGLFVRIEDHWGGNTNSSQTFIDMEVLVKMFERQGYEVTKASK